MSLIGNKAIEKVFIGSKEVQSIFVGSNKVYSSGPSVDPVLNNNDWATIKAICEAGQASNYWALGDYKEDTVNNVTVRFRIADLTVGRYKTSDNQDNNIVFELCWYVANFGNSWNCIYPTLLDMNSTDTNAGGWNGSERRTWLNSTFKSYLSAKLQAILTRTFGIKTRNNGNQAGAALITSQDYLFFAAEKEIFGTRSNSWSTEANELTQFGLYSANNTASFRTKYYVNGAAGWWLRSPYYNSGSQFCVVNYAGSSNTGYASWANYGIVPFMPL